MRIGPFIIGKKTVIHDGTGSPYLIRWTLLACGRFSIKLHKILRSDHDRDLHTHPWRFKSIILRGGYYEHVPTRMPPVFTPNGDTITNYRWHGAGDVIEHDANDPHRLVIPPGRGPTWTLVFCGPTVCDWGFWIKNQATGEAQWIDWRTYLGMEAVHEYLEQ